jgi:prepilin-type N-terminal cleavage/methylation domain-containing protein
LEIEMGNKKGFSLIELLITVAIILIIAAIALPNLLRARISANESSAAASLRTIVTADSSYSTAYPAVGYAASLGSLGPADAACTAGATSTNACIIDFVLSKGTKSGYSFTASQIGAAAPYVQFVGTGVPMSTTTGVKGFCATEDNVVRFITPAGPAADHPTCLGATYSPIQ